MKLLILCLICGLGNFTYIKPVISYQKNDLVKPIQLRDSITVRFADGFHDTVEIYQNEICIFKDYLVSNKSSGSTNRMISVLRKVNGDTLTICIPAIKKYSNVKLDWTYPLLSVNVSNKYDWHFNFGKGPIFLE